MRLPISIHFFLQYIAADLSPRAVFLPKASEKEGNYSWVLTGGLRVVGRGGKEVGSREGRKASGCLRQGLKNVTHVNFAEEKKGG